MTAGLAARVGALLTDAAAAYAGSPEEARLRVAAARLRAPLRVAIAGRIKAGKSTLLNALVGDRLAATDAGECTRIVTEYSGGVANRAWVHPWSGPPQQVPFQRVGGVTVPDLGTYAAESLERLRVEVPNEHLDEMTLIDTPGMSSLSSEVSARTSDFLAGGGSEGGVDAVLYLLRHLHGSDVNFLEAFHDVEFRGTSPVNAIGVLSRADEIGSGRGDGLRLAGDIARRYRREPRVRGLVSTVVPVAGLLGQSAAAWRERDHQLVRDLAAVPPERLGPLLLSADRFATAAPDDAGGVSPEDRRALLAGLGLYGVRLSLALLQAGVVRSAGELADELLRRSGLPELRAVLQTAFVERRDLLKAQVALRQLSAVLAARPVPAADAIRRRQEEILASAHELAELRLLNDMRAAEDVRDEDEQDATERLLGAAGATPAQRLGLPAGTPAEELRAAAMSALRMWQRRAESPALSERERRAAEVLRRTCEGLLAGLSPAEPVARRVRAFG